MSVGVRLEEWPYKVPFRIARGSLYVQHLLTLAYVGNGIRAQSEAEAAESDIAEAAACADQARFLLENGLPTVAEVAALKPGPMRNAIDCLLWDVEAKRRGVRAWSLAELEIDDATRIETAVTVTIDAPEAMAAAAARFANARTLKVKLGDGGIDLDIERAFAVAAAAPRSGLLIDPNEGWSFADLQRFLDAARGLEIVMIEQPLPRDADSALGALKSPIPICADEACTTRESLPRLVGKYHAINIKLDKTGGLTEALALQAEARRLGFRIMTGCNGGTSLAIAPAFLIAAGSDVVDIDGPLHLVSDRPNAMVFEGLRVSPPSSALWG